VSVADGTDTSSASAIRNAVVAYALQFVGNPYVYGGSSLTNGTDCSGFTMSVYANFGYSLPHSSSSQSGCGTSVSLDSLLPGDLLFYTNGGSSIGHVAMYIGNGQVVHASTPATGIKISNANYRTPLCAVRIIN
jgi:cell wall-associated NlpC family hydrolase